MIINFYRGARGDAPVVDFIENLPATAKAKVLRTMDLLERYGSQLPYPHAKKISAALYELRVVGGDNIRILYGFDRSNKEVILLHAFKKKSQKLPSPELKLAEKRLHKYNI